MNENFSDKKKQLDEFIKKRDEINKMIEELSKDILSYNKLNLNLNENFIKKYPPLELEFMKKDPKDLLKHKLFINKKCNQISNDVNHTKKIIEELLPFVNDNIFIELFVIKIIEQGKIQVSNHLDSYKPISYILLELNKKNNRIVDSFIRLIIRKEVNEIEIRGIYAIYFGVLLFLDDYKNSWFFLASILNTTVNIYTGKVLELYFQILTELIAKYNKKRLIKIEKYLETYFYKELNDKGTEIRIKNILQNGIKGESNK